MKVKVKVRMLAVVALVTLASLLAFADAHCEYSYCLPPLLDGGPISCFCCPNPNEPCANEVPSAPSSTISTGILQQQQAPAHKTLLSLSL